MRGTTLALALVALTVCMPVSLGSISIISFLDLSKEHNEAKQYKAYRMAFTEFFSGNSFADMSPSEASTQLAAVLESKLQQDASWGVKVERYRATLQVPSGSGTTGVLLRWTVIDRSGKNTNETGALMDTVLAYERNVQNREVFLLGGYGSSEEAVKAQWAKDNHVVLLTAGAATSSIFTNNAYAFGLLSSVANLADSTMALLDSQFKDGTFMGLNSNTGADKLKIALLWEDVAHGWEYRDGVLNWIKLHDSLGTKFEIVYKDAFPLNAYKSQPEVLMQTVAAFRASPTGRSANALLVDAHSGDFRVLHEALTAEDINLLVITYGARGTDVNDVEALIKGQSPQPLPGSAGKAAMRRSLVNMFAGLWWSPGLGNAQSIRFVTAHRKHEALYWLSSLDVLQAKGKTQEVVFASTSDQEAPSWFAAVAYEAMRVQLNVLSLMTIDTINSQGLINAFSKIDMGGALLPGERVTFNVHGQFEGGSSFAQNTLRESFSDDQSTLAQSDASGVVSYITSPAQEASANFTAYLAWTAPRPACLPQWYSFSVGACNAVGNARAVTYSFLNLDGSVCPDPSKPCYCDLENPSAVVPMAYEIPCEYISSGSGEEVVTNMLGALGIIYCVALLFLLIFSWRNPAFRFSERPYLAAVCVSAMLTCVGILTLPGDNTDIRCRYRVAGIVLPLGLLLSFLAGRILYWFRLWQEPIVEHLYPSSAQLAIPLGICFSMFAILTIVWLAVQPAFSMSSTKPVSGADFVYLRCVYFADGYQSIPTYLLSYTALLVLILVFCSSQAKNCDGRYFETKYLHLVTLNTGFVSAIIAVLCGLVTLNSTTNLILVAVALFWLAVSIVTAIFMPRLIVAYHVYLFGNNNNTVTNTGMFKRNSITNNAEPIMTKKRTLELKDVNGRPPPMIKTRGSDMQSSTRSIFNSKFNKLSNPSI